MFMCINIIVQICAEIHLHVSAESTCPSVEKYLEPKNECRSYLYKCQKYRVLKILGTATNRTREKSPI